MRPIRLRTSATEAFATKRLRAHYRTNHVAGDINVADMGRIGQCLCARVDAGLDAQGESVAERVDLFDDGFGGLKRAAA